MKRSRMDKFEIELRKDTPQVVNNGGGGGAIIIGVVLMMIMVFAMIVFMSRQNAQASYVGTQQPHYRQVQHQQSVPVHTCGVSRTGLTGASLPHERSFEDIQNEYLAAVARQSARYEGMAEGNQYGGGRETVVEGGGPILRSSDR